MTESQIQIAFFDWCRLWAQRPGYSDLAWIFHVPNGGARSKATAGRMKAEGVTPGVADVLWLRPGRLPLDDVRGSRRGYLALEFKADAGRVSDAQREFGIWSLRSGNGAWLVVRGAGEAAVFVCRYAGWDGDILADAQELAQRDAPVPAASRRALVAP